MKRLSSVILLLLIAVFSFVQFAQVQSAVAADRDDVVVSDTQYAESNDVGNYLLSDPLAKRCGASSRSWFATDSDLSCSGRRQQIGCNSKNSRRCRATSTRYRCNSRTKQLGSADTGRSNHSCLWVYPTTKIASRCRLTFASSATFRTD